MDHQRQALRIGTAAIAFAVLLRLFSFTFSAARDIFQETDWLSLAVFLQTGRVVRYPQVQKPEPEETEPTQPEMPQTPAQLPVFSQGDLEAVGLINDSGYRVDLKPLLTSALSWDLTDGQPAVLILHTHATESYTPTQGTQYEASGDYRTLDVHYNMVSIGEEVARILREGGVEVIHDKSYHDYPSYNGSYNNARKTIADYLEEYPSIRMVLDIHRDAAAMSNGGQLNTSATVGGQPSAQIMVVIGTDATGNHHPNWRQNLSLALKLSAQLERENPGITRPIHLRPERFNMDMTAGSLLVEVGAAGDTHDEAIIAANALARAVLALARGTSQ
jgi:stage II sporulation protein P